MGRQIKSVRSHRAAKNLTHNSRKHAFTHTPIALALAGVLLCGAAHADSITYTGDTSILKPINGRANSLSTELDNSGNSTSTNGNTVTVNDTNSTPTVIQGDVYGAFQKTATQTSTDNNTVDFIAGRVIGYIYAGYAEVEHIFAQDSTADATATAKNNQVVFGGSTWEDVYGGYARAETIVANNSATVTASSNAVTIGAGGTVEDNVYGGYAEADTSQVNSLATVTANSNTVTVGGTVGDGILGGFAYSYTDGNNSAASAFASNNTITVSGQFMAARLMQIQTAPTALPLPPPATIPLS